MCLLLFEIPVFMYVAPCLSVCKVRIIAAVYRVPSSPSLLPSLLPSFVPPSLLSSLSFPIPPSLPQRHGPYVDKDGRVRHVKKVGEEIPEQPREGKQM